MFARRPAFPPRFQRLRVELLKIIPAQRLLCDPLSVSAYAGDASFYRLTPKLIVRARNEDEVASVLAACARHGLPATFRAAGTSLSGQAVSDSVLIHIGRGFRKAKVLDAGTRIRLEPGVIGAAANRLLAPYHRKIGPDPASIDSAMIGGIAANNASGMCCGAAQNCYRTLDSMRIVFADGARLDTADAASRTAFAASHATLLEGLQKLGAQVRADAPLRALISRKYELKNTTGYGLNSLIDFEDPIDILQHLLIGSEGTLGFISEITLRTVPDPPCKAAVLAFFADAESAGRAVAALLGSPAQAVEYMDEASLRAVGKRGAAALLIDLRAESNNQLARSANQIAETLAAFPLSRPPFVSSNAFEYQNLWSIRKGLFPAVGSTRPAGTTVLIEDVAFPPLRLAEALSDLRALLDENGYAGSIIYGHALAGNLHFVFWQDFSAPAEVERYAAFMDRLAELVVGKYHGSLKAEHGTGRNMAPFVEREWGPRAYALMSEIKRLFDPLGILNPDVILSADKRLHMKNLKPMPLAHPLVDACIECGFCESVCPSRDLTLTPRQRIAVKREIARVETRAKGKRGFETGRAFDGARLRALRNGFDYQGERTCAADGLCATKCPVGIDTGKMIKALRAEANVAWRGWAADWAAGRFPWVTRMLRLGLMSNQAARSIFGRASWTRILRGLARILPIPPGLEYLPGPAPRLPENVPVVPSRAANPVPSRETAANFSAPPTRRILYFPSCVNRLFGPERAGDPSLPQVTTDLMRRAGFEPVLPQGIDSLCCGLAFASKGFERQGAEKLRGTERALEAGMRDRLVAVCDASPCTQRLKENLPASLPMLDSAEFMVTYVLPRLSVRRRAASVAVHAACSAVKMGSDGDLRILAEACAENAIAPGAVTCCGVAGDRIFSHPELPLSACSGLKDALPRDCREGYSTSRTCEIGLSAASGIAYRSILYLLHETSAPAAASASRGERAAEPQLQAKESP